MQIGGRWRRIAVAVALTRVLGVLSSGVASAHAHLVQADPTPDSTIAHAPRVATFVFD